MYIKSKVNIPIGQRYANKGIFMQMMELRSDCWLAHTGCKKEISDDKSENEDI
jgi:hypothetical protein